MDPPASFDHIAARYQGGIRTYLVRLLGHEQDAEDVCQNAFLRAHRAFARLAPNSNTRAWLYKIATNSALSALKSRRRRTTGLCDLDLDTLPADAAAPPERREQLRAVDGAVRALPPKQRAALMQRQFQGLSYAEIGAILGCSEASARANVYQAIKKLRAALDRPQAR